MTAPSILMIIRQMSEIANGDKQCLEGRLGHIWQVEGDCFPAAAVAPTEN